jgi:hypothetical protein
MGVEYSSRVVVGFEFEAEDLENVFAHEQPELSHMEPRFHSKTGKKLADEKVIDQKSHTIFSLEPADEGEDCLETFCEEHLAGYLDCAVHVASDSWSGNVGKIVIGPHIKTSEEYEFDRMTLYAGCLLKDLLKLEPELERIRRQLVNLGLKPGAAVVTVVTSIY